MVVGTGISCLCGPLLGVKFGVGGVGGDESRWIQGVREGVS